MKRTESSAKAMMRHESLPARALAEAAASAVAPNVAVVMPLLPSFRVMKADLLQLWHRGGGAGDEDHARNQVVGELSRERLMRQLVGVHVRFDQRGRLLPDRVMA